MQSTVIEGCVESIRRDQKDADTVIVTASFYSSDIPGTISFTIHIDYAVRYFVGQPLWIEIRRK